MCGGPLKCGAPVRPNMFEHWLIRPCHSVTNQTLLCFKEGNEKGCDKSLKLWRHPWLKF